MGTISQILQLVLELLRWRRVEAEISARRLVLTELERVDDEIDILEKQIAGCRKSGDHVRADQLLLSQVRRTSFERGILDLAEGANVHCPTNSDIGGPAGGSTKRQDDNRPAESDQEKPN